MATVDAAIINLLEGKEKQWKTKSIVKNILANMPDATKKEVKTALKRLEKNSKVSREGKKIYALAVSEKEPVPIAEALRRRKVPNKAAKQDAKEKTSKSNRDDNSAEDIDEEIRRLEAELAADSEDDSEDDEDSAASDQQHESNQNQGVISLSTLASDRIDALPETALPFNKRRYMKIDKESQGEPQSKRHKKDKRERKKDKEPPRISQGLQAAVNEVLSGYQPRSNEKLPFYCRQCAKQYTNEEEFFAHKKTDFHKAAVAMEKKATYCKLCRKQLTSPVQMKEHLLSKKHRDLLQKMRDKQGRW